MTELEWFACSNPGPMLKHLGSPGVRVSARKLRLFIVACCRPVMRLMRDSASRRAVDVAERFVDGGTTDRKRGTAWRAASHVRFQVADPIGQGVACAAALASNPGCTPTSAGL